MRMQIWRCSRTACWAARIERGRPIVTGKIVPGNSTKPRTGAMISASGGTLMPAADPVSASAARHRERWAIKRRSVYGELSGLLQADHETAVDRGAPYVGVMPRRQRDAALETPLRQLEPMDHRLAQRGRNRPHADDEELAIVDRGLDPIDVYARQRHQHQDFALGFEHVDRRLPGGHLRARALQPEGLAMQPFGPREHLAGFRPHPDLHIARVHGGPGALASAVRGEG